MPFPEILLLLAAAALPRQAGDFIPEDATAKAVTEQTYAYLAAKDGARYELAYDQIDATMRAYLKPDLYRAQAAQFNAEAGRAAERRVTRLTWYRDPADAPAPGIYVAADFRSRFANIDLHCGYVMWHQDKDGRFRIVREEQSFIDKGMARQMAPERVAQLPRQFGCVD